MRQLAIPWSTIHAYTSTTVNDGVFVPRTAWMSSGGINIIRWVFEFAAMMTNFRVIFAYQYADSETANPTTVTLGSASTAAGFNRGASTPQGETIVGAPLIRFGFVTWNSSASTLVTAAAGGYVEYGGC